MKQDPRIHAAIHPDAVDDILKMESGSIDPDEKRIELLRSRVIILEAQMGRILKAMRVLFFLFIASQILTGIFIVIRLIFT